ACQNDPDISINMNSEVIDCTNHQNGISALVNKDSRIDTFRGKMLICADGIRSKFRTELFDQPPAKHTGFEAWRSMIPADQVPTQFSMDFTHLIMGRGRHAVFYPVRGGRHLNVVLVTKSREKIEYTRHNADPEFIHSKTRFWNTAIRKILRSGDEWSVWPILTVPYQKKWSSGAVVMIGDAAHGMPPFAAQGAALAIEDAQVLVNCVADESDLEKAFAMFQAKRSKRVKKVAKLADTNRQIYHMGFPFSWVRNLGMALTSPKKLLERQAWIYEWRAKD
ncbi:MAG: FAD-dependent monooxygenase, partial [Salaquimonas sp.]